MWATSSAVSRATNSSRFPAMRPAHEKVPPAAELIVKTLAQPFILHESLVHIGASVGISQYPQHGSSGPQLLICADRAMYAVQAQRQERVCGVRRRVHASDDSLSLLRKRSRGRNPVARAPACESNINRSSTSPTTRSSGAKRSCAGRIRPAANSRRAPSCRSRSAPA
ncbi:MAG: diguanylate cyclase [Pararobbsia sp.]